MKRRGPLGENIRAVLSGYRALQPHEKLIALHEMGFTLRESEDAVMLEMRRLAKEALETFKLAHRKAAPVVRIERGNDADDDLIAKE
jgi:hypothetical protein